MQDLKTGALLKASPRSQFYGQMIGSLASVFVSSAAYKLYKSVYEIPGPAFRVPTAAIWSVRFSRSDADDSVADSLRSTSCSSHAGSTLRVSSTPATFPPTHRCS